MLHRLPPGPATSGQLADLLPTSRPAASQHVRVLHEAGLLRTTAPGRQHWHALPPAPVRGGEPWVPQLLDPDPSRKVLASSSASTPTTPRPADAPADGRQDRPGQ